MINKNVLILTDPIPFDFIQTLSKLRHPVKFVKQNIFRRSSILNNFIGGHPGVTNSLLRGFIALRQNVNFNSLNLGKPNIAVVLSGVQTLKQALELKSQGKVTHILAGPNVVTYPDEFSQILCNPQIDVCIVPSLWVKKMYSNIRPQIHDKIVVWASGVDSSFWKPKIIKNPINKNGNVLFYIKESYASDLLNVCRSKFDSLGLNVNVIEYGHYERRHFKYLLESSDLMIVFGGTESQGLAMHEAWSMNVPTFVLANDFWKRSEVEIFPSTASPYLNNQTGFFFSDESSLFVLIESWITNKINFNPRNWILENATDEISTRNLLNIIEDTC